MRCVYRSEGCSSTKNSVAAADPPGAADTAAAPAGSFGTPKKEELTYCSYGGRRSSVGPHQKKADSPWTDGAISGSLTVLPSALVLAGAKQAKGTRAPPDAGLSCVWVCLSQMQCFSGWGAARRAQGGVAATNPWQSTQGHVQKDLRRRSAPVEDVAGAGEKRRQTARVAPRSSSRYAATKARVVKGSQSTAFLLAAQNDNSGWIRSRLAAAVQDWPSATFEPNREAVQQHHHRERLAAWGRSSLHSSTNTSGDLRLMLVPPVRFVADSGSGGVAFQVPAAATARCLYTRTLVGIFGRLAEQAAQQSWGLAPSHYFELRTAAGTPPAATSVEGGKKCAGAAVATQAPGAVSTAARGSREARGVRAPWYSLLLLKAALLQHQTRRQKRFQQHQKHPEEQLDFSLIPPWLLRAAAELLRSPQNSPAALLQQLHALCRLESPPSEKQLKQIQQLQQQAATAAKDRRSERRNEWQLLLQLQHVRIYRDEWMLLLPLLPFCSPFEALECLLTPAERETFIAVWPGASFSAAAAAAAATALADTDAAAAAAAEASKANREDTERALRVLGMSGAATALAATAVAELQLLQQGSFAADAASAVDESDSVVLARPNTATLQQHLQQSRSSYTQPPVALPLLHLHQQLRAKQQLLLHLRGATLGSPEELPRTTLPARSGDWQTHWLQQLNAVFERELVLDTSALRAAAFKAPSADAAAEAAAREDISICPSVSAALNDVFDWLAHPQPYQQEQHGNKRFVSYSSIRERLLQAVDGEPDETLFLEDSIRCLRSSRNAGSSRESRCCWSKEGTAVGARSLAFTLIKELKATLPSLAALDQQTRLEADKNRAKLPKGADRERERNKEKKNDRNATQNREAHRGAWRGEDTVSSERKPVHPSLRGGGRWHVDICSALQHSEVETQSPYQGLRFGQILK
ncbi:uncharacterized protein LOC34621006 [Cyclospora cayetanensis]|uniref:Uncharacterized protein LOC34621006 n=1 Tax=Cyclospora cayetanensis TaxID=88456 RepID=A0A6P6RZJ6_9EIME|nr:uncharacterized protein LOC34621006 [Cyclospora cayetanensis]